MTKFGLRRPADAGHVLDGAQRIAARAGHAQQLLARCRLRLVTSRGGRLDGGGRAELQRRLVSRGGVRRLQAIGHGREIAGGDLLVRTRAAPGPRRPASDVIAAGRQLGELERAGGVGDRGARDLAVRRDVTVTATPAIAWSVPREQHLALQLSGRRRGRRRRFGGQLEHVAVLDARRDRVVAALAPARTRTGGRPRRRPRRSRSRRVRPRAPSVTLPVASIVSSRLDVGLHGGRPSRPRDRSASTNVSSLGGVSALAWAGAGGAAGASRASWPCAAWASAVDHQSDGEGDAKCGSDVRTSWRAPCSAIGVEPPSQQPPCQGETREITSCRRATRHTCPRTGLDRCPVPAGDFPRRVSLPPSCGATLTIREATAPDRSSLRGGARVVQERRGLFRLAGRFPLRVGCQRGPDAVAPGGLGRVHEPVRPIDEAVGPDLPARNRRPRRMPSPEWVCRRRRTRTCAGWPTETALRWSGPPRPSSPPGRRRTPRHPSAPTDPPCGSGSRPGDQSRPGPRHPRRDLGGR